MNINKLVHETRGKCWHEWLDNSTATCVHCGECLLFAPTSADYVPSTRNPDYENDTNACMGLWDDNGGVIQLTLDEEWNTGEPVWIAASSVDYSDNDGRAETPQLAIIAAYLKSKGVDLEKESK